MAVKVMVQLVGNNHRGCKSPLLLLHWHKVQLVHKMEIAVEAVGNDNSLRHSPEEYILKGEDLPVPCLYIYVNNYNLMNELIPSPSIHNRPPPKKV